MVSTASGATGSEFLMAAGGGSSAPITPGLVGGSLSMGNNPSPSNQALNLDGTPITVRRITPSVLTY